MVFTSSLVFCCAMTQSLTEGRLSAQFAIHNAVSEGPQIEMSR
jgi:hypothetical protein